MTAAIDYASFYELEIRPRRSRLRYAGVLAVWAVLFLLRPRLALRVWAERG